MWIYGAQLNLFLEAMKRTKGYLQPLAFFKAINKELGGYGNAVVFISTLKILAECWY
jgi:hypothetical protein